MDIFDDIDLGGEVCGVVRVPSQPILGDNPIDDAPKPRKDTFGSSRNPVDVMNWRGEPDFVLTLSAGVRLSRKALSDAIAEWRIAHPRIDRVRVYVGNHPLVNLPIHVLKSCGFERTSLERCWERDLTKRMAPKPEAKQEEIKPEPMWNAWESELASIRERRAFCTRNNIRFFQTEIDREKWLTEQITAEKERRQSPEQKALDAQIKAIGEQLAELQKGKS
jgi:hypothetical protein